jgi:glycosyltransferase involved in cell wall biosynthesis
MSKLISVVIPMYFEEENVMDCYTRLGYVLKNREYELIFVNDGSTDRTLPLLEELAEKDKRVKVISFSRNFGHQMAVSAGIEHARGDGVVLIDADLQDPPEVILEMIAKWEEGYDVVYGKRAKREGESAFKKVTAKLFYRFLDKMSDVKIPRDTGDFRLMDRKVVNALLAMPEKNRFIRGMVSWIGFRQTAVTYVRNPRLKGETKYPLKKMLKFAMDAIVGFSSKPLRMITWLGVLTLIVGFGLLVYTIVSKILGGTEAGWASIMVAIVFFSGVQLISLGIVGEYLARIYEEAKNRPMYIIEKEINFEE